jgi:hypothetical protein
METYTWVPGTEPELDKIFDDAREARYQDRHHRLWENYSKDHFESAVALTIAFNKEGIPEMCSSISSRECWPQGAYRILNRLWKHSNKVFYPRVMSLSFAESAKSQIDWLEQHTNCKLFFISRQTDNWQEWVMRNFREVYDVDFSTDTYKYLTCPNECDSTCWQSIIYNGDAELLTDWNRR